jgi:hypothetical protein
MWPFVAVCGRIAVEVDLVTADGASDAVFQLAHLGFCSAAGIVICCFAAGGNVFISDPPTSLGLNSLDDLLPCSLLPDLATGPSLAFL